MGGALAAGQPGVEEGVALYTIQYNDFTHTLIPH